MIDKATFEAHVRAEAERKHPVHEIGRPPMAGEDGYWVTYDANKDLREARISARMEHEWPLVEFTTKLLDYWQAGNFSRHPFQMELQDILTPYITKPIEP